MYRLIACDVDGTLLDENFAISQIDKSAIKKAQEKDIKVFLCSGRSYKSLTGIAKELGIDSKGNYIIGFNGAIVYDMQNEKIVNEETLDKDIAVDIVKKYKEHSLKIEIVVYVDGENVLMEEGAVYSHKYQATSKTEFSIVNDILSATKSLKSISKIIFIGENQDLKVLESSLFAAFGDIAAVFLSAQYLLEVGPKECSKGKALEWICKQLDVSVSETIAIGDNYNDISMIQTAGLGAVVANAVDEAKKIADYVAEKDCASGGVAEIIHKFAL